MPLEIVRNDITMMKTDAIVNSAHPTPRVGGGVDYAIHAKAGAELIAARQKIGDIATGEAFITPGFKLPAKYVIHTVGPIWQEGKQGQREQLANCYKNSLRLASENHCASVAFPLISAGVFGCPAEIAIAVAVQAIREFLAEHEMKVYLVVYDRKAFRISGSLFDDVRDYLDRNYLEEIAEKECRAEEQNIRRKEMGLPAFGAALPRVAKSRMMEMDEAPAPMRIRAKKIAGDGHSKASEKAPRKTTRSLADLVNEVDDTFSEALLRLITAKDKTDPEIYKRANIDRKHFAKIRKNPNYQPSKATALAFAVALELNLDETKDFIGRAGYALSHSSKADIIVEYFIEREEYDIFTIMKHCSRSGSRAWGHEQRHFGRQRLAPERCKAEEFVIMYNYNEAIRYEEGRILYVGGSGLL